ncbi:MAG: hypothetical protein AMJ78_06220 [Omnitrophica WOR_2 bacterium SM23_29]|nr:MAG: hypothetical protein AMJ78_06220 [Omnitrophica WOR_2 bacterium SM23_29]
MANKPAKKRRRRFPFFKIFLALIILLGIGLWYANEYILPVKGKELVIDYLTKSTGRYVTLESIYYNPFRGLVLKNLTISDDPKYERTFLKIDRLYFNVLYFPIFQEKKIIIPLIKVDSPKFILTIDNENRWNFESLHFLKLKKMLTPEPPEAPQLPETPEVPQPLEAPQPPPTPEAPEVSQEPQFKVLIYRVALSNATCTFEDRALEPMFSKDIEDIDFQASISYPLKIKYKLNSRLKVEQKNSIAAKGEFDPQRKEIRLNLQLKDVPLSEFQPYYEGLPFKSLSGNLSGDPSLLYSQDNTLEVETASTKMNIILTLEDSTLKGEVDLNGKMSLDLKESTKMNCDISASTKIDNLDLKAKDFSVKGGVDANSKISLDLKDKKTLKYSTDTLLRDVRLSGVPTLDVIEKLNGKLYFDETRLWSDSIKGMSRGTAIVFAGSVKDYSNPYLDLTAETELNLAKLNEFLTDELKERLKSYEIAGLSQTTLKVKGLLKEKTPLEYTLTSELSNCNIKPEFLPKPIASVKGRIVSKANYATLTDISGVYDNKSYTLNGNISNFKSPQIDLRLVSEELKLKTIFTLQDALATFNKFEGEYKNTRFNLFGAVSDFEDPLLDVRGSIALNVDELKNYLPKQNVELLTKNEVSGDLATKFYFKGKWKNQKTWQIDLKAESPQFKVRKFKFDDLYLEYKFKDNFVSVPTLISKPYGGRLTANIAIDYSQENPQYVIEVDIKDVDISKWKNDTEFKNKDLRGLFYARAEFGGFGENIETLGGKGQFAIVQGKLWELPVFAGLANILFIPGVDKIVFREARGSFTVGNKAVHTSDTEIRATEMNLVYDGSVDFDGNLAFSVTIAFAKDLLATPSRLGPIRDLFLIDQAGNYIGDIKLKGTLKEPRYTIKPFPIDKILQNKLMDKLRDIF